MRRAKPSVPMRWLAVAATILSAACGGGGGDGGTGPAPTGSVTVTVATTGTALDPDGYALSLDDGAAIDLPVNGSQTISGLAVGKHTVALVGVAGTCTATPPASVTVAASQTATLRIDVACTAPTSGLIISTRTTGTPVDPDGYKYSIDGGAPVPIAVNTMAPLPTLAAGIHTVVMDGAWAYCQSSIGATGREQKVVTVGTGAPTTVEFAFDCAQALRNRIVYFYSDGGSTAGLRAMHPDGTGRTLILPSQTPFFDVSRDGRTIVVAEATGPAPLTPKFSVFNADGSLVRNITPAASCATTPALSPDGSKIAFGNCADGKLYIMNVDGTGESVLGSSGGFPDGEPVWSADGSKIIYVESNGPVGNLWMMNPNGTGRTALTSYTSLWISTPRLSPDGMHVSFVRGDIQTNFHQVYVTNLDGSSPVTITAPGYYGSPAFSPDGTELAYWNDAGGQDIFRAKADGTGTAINLTNTPVPVSERNLQWVW